MARNGRMVVLIATWGLATWVMGCAKSPQAEIDTAKSGIQAAEQVGASDYATTELEAARAALTRADSLVAVKNYRAAKAAALEAAEKANEAKTAAENKKAELAASLEKQLSDLGGPLNAIKADLAQVSKRLPSRTRQAVESKVGEAERLLGEASSSYNSGTYRDAQQRLNAVEANLNSAKEALELAKAKPAAGKKSPRKK